MARIISASIDLTKIVKSKIIEGKKGKYLNIQVSINDEVDQYGNDANITINQSKEEREAKTPKVYLGNGKTVWHSGVDAKPAPATPAPEETGDDGLPF